jgi:hypothetical protein
MAVNNGKDLWCDMLLLFSVPLNASRNIRVNITINKHSLFVYFSENLRAEGTLSSVL